MNENEVVLLEGREVILYLYDGSNFHTYIKAVYPSLDRVEVLMKNATLIILNNPQAANTIIRNTSNFKLIKLSSIRDVEETGLWQLNVNS